MLKIGEILFKFRDYTPIPWIILMVVYANAGGISLLIGGLSIVLGELIRIHGVAFIGGVSRTRTFSTGQKIITSGPFARVRNPLYVGNLLLSMGLVICSNVEVGLTPHDNIYFTLLFVLFFFLQYIPIVNWEENNLKSIFGKDYEDYLKKVPRWIPKLIVDAASKSKIEGEYMAAIKSEKNTLTTTVVVLGLVFLQSGYFNF